MNSNISIAGLYIYDSYNELSSIEKFGAADILFAVQYSTSDKPLMFQYLSDESISSFDAVLVDFSGNEVERINLNTGIITSVSGVHSVTGEDNLSKNLCAGLFYFEINGHYRSEFFIVTYEILPNYLELMDGSFLELMDVSFLELMTS